MRKLLRTSGSIAAAVAAMSAAAAFAQDGAGETPKPGTTQSEIVVTGTRRNDLKAADSAQPIDIITGAELLEKGTADMNDLLRTEVPSLNVQRLVSNDGAVFTRPFSLRGLPPDQTLVLVNGKRRHRGATVQFTNIPYIRGSQGPDGDPVDRDRPARSPSRRGVRALRIGCDRRRPQFRAAARP